MPITPEQWWEKLVAFGELNGLVVTAKPFDPHALAGPEARRSLPLYYEAGRWPAADNVGYFLNSDVEPIAITTEPSPSDELADLQTLTRLLRLTIHVPPNPRASLLHPGWRPFLVIARPSFGRVRWLQEQLD
ncbi:MAG: hypothetical protein ACT6RL_05025 [Neoaquamicrobium sediminum]|uniref:hypothetical protein n=1 Tax=Neoaquamicrobium sediminum TaxID=1849104 RepID=UPI00403650D3